MSAPFLEVQGITRTFGATTALKDVHLTVRADELLVVLGPTGAGKTTLLRTIAGLETPDAGRLLQDGQDITTWAPPARDVSLVFQNFSLYPDWTVRRNLEFPLRAPGRRLSPADLRQRVAEAAALLHIEPLLERRASRLSGGEMQRVAIGRAIVRRPRLFLMDEPLTNLDAKLREALRVELAVLRRNLGTPMVYVTHDQAEALSMGDRVVVLNHGEVLQTGTPEEVYRTPATPVVAQQLGQPPINLLPVRAEGGYWRLEDGTTWGPAPWDAPPRALLGVRPEDVAPQGGEREAEVRLVEDMGSHKVLLVRFGATDLHLLVPRDHPVRPGDRLKPRADHSRMVVWPEPGPPLSPGRASG